MLFWDILLGPDKKACLEVRGQSKALVNHRNWATVAHAFISNTRETQAFNSSTEKEQTGSNKVGWRQDLSPVGCRRRQVGSNWAVAGCSWLSDPDI